MEKKLKDLTALCHHYTKRARFDYDEKIFEKTIILRLDIQEITGKRC